jgi:hypothetical protein
MQSLIQEQGAWPSGGNAMDRSYVAWVAFVVCGSFSLAGCCDQGPCQATRREATNLSITQGVAGTAAGIEDECSVCCVCTPSAGTTFVIVAIDDESIGTAEARERLLEGGHIEATTTEDGRYEAEAAPGTYLTCAQGTDSFFCVVTTVTADAVTTVNMINLGIGVVGDPGARSFEVFVP